MDLELDVSVSNDLEKNFRDLREGKVDLIAMNLTVTSETKVGSGLYRSASSNQAGACSEKT